MNKPVKGEQKLKKRIKAKTPLNRDFWRKKSWKMLIFAVFNLVLSLLNFLWCWFRMIFIYPLKLILKKIKKKKN